MTRVAALDLGTNSTRLLVADVVAGAVYDVARRVEITGLGRGVDRDGALSADARERVHACLDRYVAEAGALGAGPLLATATSAVRDAANGAEFLAEVERRHGARTRLLSGDEEAELTFRGATAGRALDGGTLVVDIGGGSTELVLGGPEGISFARSVQAGCVRMTERHLHGDPPAPAELDACAADVRSLLPPLEARTAIGVAGTVTTLAALDLGLVEYDPERVHGHRLPRAGVRHHLCQLAAMDLAERRRLPGLEPARAPVIVAGALVLLTILDAYGLDEIEASERDLLHGVAMLAARE